MSRLQEFYHKEVVPQLMKQLGLKNPNAVPRITKVTLNMGVGEALADKKVLESAMGDLAKISGQKPVPTKARISVASFKVRDGVAIGCKVTLRNERMYEFLDRLINVAIPRIRDFRGVPRRASRNSSANALEGRAHSRNGGAFNRLTRTMFTTVSGSGAIFVSL